MISAVLVSSLWLASQNVPAPLSEAECVTVRAGSWWFKYTPAELDRVCPKFRPVPLEKIADGLAADLALNAVGSGLDLISTDFAINHGCKEGNPLAPRVEGRVALKAGAAAVRGSVAYWLRRHGHRRGANIWRYAGLGADLLITGSNVRCGLK